MRNRTLLHLLAFILLSGHLQAAGLKEKTIEVEGLERTYLIDIPDSSEKAEALPALVFGFHGHGGNMRNASRQFHLHELWPEAMVVYMQGLPTPGKLTDPEGKKNGWQSGAGNQGDRDLKFFDSVYESLKGKFDPARVYSMGHSNGGGFTYLLWAERGDRFAAMAPSSAASRDAMGKLKPKPVLHVAGENDPLVKFEWQKLMLAHVQKVNNCSNDYKPWKKAEDLETRIYDSETGTPLVVLLSQGGHKFPKEAPGLMVHFFKEVGK